jgi:hypothetical protein
MIEGDDDAAIRAMAHEIADALVAALA